MATRQTQSSAQTSATSDRDPEAGLATFRPSGECPTVVVPRVFVEPESVIAGRYRIVRLLGEGGMGRVLLGQDLLTGESVALKVLRDHLSGRMVFRRRLIQEARVLGAIEHPLVVRVRDLVAGPPLCLVMDYAPGPTLSEHLAKFGRLTPAHAISVALGVASALTAAHAADIIHRDVKPSNVVLSRDAAGREMPILIDFGVAKYGGKWLGSESTHRYEVAGTPCYMSPEQMRGEQSDSRSDLYALGCMLFEMIAGCPPIPKSIAQAALARREIGCAPTSLGDIVSDLPRGLEAIVSRLMARDPGCRFSSTLQLIAALKRIETPTETLHLTPHCPTQWQSQTTLRPNTQTSMCAEADQTVREWKKGAQA